MPDFNSEQATQVLVTVSIGIAAAFIGIKKIFQEWKTTKAETSVITLMHTELERMSEQNTSLSKEIGRLHDEIINLTQQLQKLNLENQRLQTEVCSLTDQIRRIKNAAGKD